MKKALLALAALATVAVSSVAVPSTADARCRGCGVGIAAGIIGLGVGAAIANSYGPAYVVQPGYAAYPAYAGGAPVGCPGGYWPSAGYSVAG